MKDGAIVANAGHFNVEIDIPALESVSSGKRQVRDFVEEFTLKNGRHVNLLGEGRLINLAAAEGHPAMVMDMSFANQALSVRWLIDRAEGLRQERLSRPGRDRRGDRPPEARLDGLGDRQADAGPEEIPGRLAGRHLSGLRDPRPR